MLTKVLNYFLYTSDASIYLHNNDIYKKNWQHISTSQWYSMYAVYSKTVQYKKINH